MRPGMSVSHSTSVARIAVVEDNPADVYLLEKALKQNEILFQLTLFTDGEQAIASFSRDDVAVPDLIILDLNLPRREGFDVLHVIRGRPRLVEVPVAILTSSDAVKDRHRIELLGGEKYIHKPLNLEEFVNQVGQALKNLLRTHNR